MAVAKKIQDYMEQGSWIRKIFEEGIILSQKYGADAVFDLSLGNPVMEPPPEFFEELKRIADDPSPGMHRYMPNAGYPETRGAVAAQLSEETGLTFGADNVIMSCGAGGALNVVLKTLLDPGDEVVIFAPYFVEYFFYADNHGGSCKVVPPDVDFLPDMDAFETAIGPRTRIVLVNSPNNPSGALYTEDVLARLAEVIRQKEEEFEREIFLVSDEPYRRLLYDGLEYPHVFHHHVRSIVATSHSKDLALPGERIGYVAVHPDYTDAIELMDGLIFCNRTLGFVNAPALMQHNIVAKLQVGHGGHFTVPGQARLHVRRAHEPGLRPSQATRGVLHVPQVSDRRRRGLRRGASEVQRFGRPRNGIRDARVLQDLVLRHRPDP